MYITEVSIKRPVVAWVMSLILIIFGIFVFSELPVRELPDGIQPPVVQVKTDYKSASAEIIDEEITQKLEDVIGGAEGIKNIDSNSLNGTKISGISTSQYIELVSSRLINIEDFETSISSENSLFPIIPSN